MIATGLAIELVAATVVVVGLAMGPSGAPLLWSSVAMVLVGLTVAAAGVRRVRPPRSGWTPPRAAGGIRTVE